MNVGPVQLLGARLKSASTVPLLPARSARQMVGSPDDLKPCSCMTLFERASDDACFGRAIDCFCVDDERGGAHATTSRTGRPQTRKAQRHQPATVGESR